MQKHGSTMLKVVSIIMLVFAGLGILMDIMMIAMFSDISALSGESIWTAAERLGLPTGTLNIALICLFLAVILETIAAIIGICNWYRKEKGGTCIALGWIIIVLIIVGVIFEVIFFNRLIALSSSYFSFYSFSTGLALSGIVNLVLPILYIIGAAKLKNLPPPPAPYGPGYYNGYNPYGYDPRFNNQGYPNQNYNPGYPGQQNNSQSYPNQGFDPNGRVGQ